MTAAEDIDVDPEGAAVEEGDGDYVDAPLYSFEAPASALPGSDDLGDLKVEFEATVAATYEDVHGPVAPVETRDQFDALFGLSSTASKGRRPSRPRPWLAVAVAETAGSAGSGGDRPSERHGCVTGGARIRHGTRIS
jgi:hypothetical protein